MARFLAIDWDQNNLHVVLADIRGAAVRVVRACTWQEEGTPNPLQAEDQGKRLRERLREAGIAPAPLLACLGRDRLIIKEVRYPSVPESEEPAVVRFQAIKELTDAPEDVVIDYLPLGGPAGGEQRAAALVIRKEILQTYQTLAQAAGLKLTALSPRVLGVAACLRQVMGTTVVTPAPEPPDGAIAVVVVGERTAEMSVHQGSAFLLTRSVQAGAGLLNEVRRNLAVHGGQSPQHPIRAVYVAGKGAGELRERLGELTEVPVHTFDPFAGSEMTELPTGPRGTFAGSVGLLHVRAAGNPPINFVSPRQPLPPKNTSYRLVRTALVAGIALFLGLIVLGRVVFASWKEELDGLEEARKGVEAQLLATRENAKRLKAVDDWDNLVWLDELYELTARIPDVNALRITSLTTEPLTRTARSRYAARVTIKGKLLGKGNARRPLDELITRFRKEGTYSPEAPKVERDQFTLVVNVERRSPDDYRAVLPAEEVKEAPKVKSAGDEKRKSKRSRDE